MSCIPHPVPCPAWLGVADILSRMGVQWSLKTNRKRLTTSQPGDPQWSVQLLQWLLYSIHICGCVNTLIKFQLRHTQSALYVYIHCNRVYRKITKGLLSTAPLYLWTRDSAWPPSSNWPVAATSPPTDHGYTIYYIQGVNRKPIPYNTIQFIDLNIEERFNQCTYTEYLKLKLKDC